MVSKRAANASQTHRKTFIKGDEKKGVIVKSHIPTAILDFLYNLCLVDNFFELRPYFISTQDGKAFEKIKSKFDPSQHMHKLYFQTVHQPSLTNYLTSIELSNHELQSSFNHAQVICHGHDDYIDMLEGFRPWIYNVHRHREKHLKLNAPTAYSVFPYQPFDSWTKVDAIVKKIMNDSKKEEYNYIENEIEQSKVQALKMLVNVDYYTREYEKLIDMLLNVQTDNHLKIMSSSRKKVELRNNEDVKIAIDTVHGFIEQALNEISYMILLSLDKKTKNDLRDIKKQLLIVYRAIQFPDYSDENIVEVNELKEINIRAMLVKLH